MADKIYARRISSEEAKEKFIFITKDALTRFPSPDSRFKLVFDDQEFEATITAVSCDCVGSWHEHYHLTADDFFKESGIRQGSQVALFRMEPGRFLVKASS